MLIWENALSIGSIFCLFPGLFLIKQADGGFNISESKSDDEAVDRCGDEAANRSDGEIVDRCVEAIDCCDGELVDRCVEAIVCCDGGGVNICR